MNKLEFENRLCRLCRPVRLGDVLNLVIVNAAIASKYTAKKKGQPATKISIAPHVPAAGSHLVDTKSFEEGITPTSDIMKSQGKNQLFILKENQMIKALIQKNGITAKNKGRLAKSSPPTNPLNSQDLTKNLFQNLYQKGVYLYD